MTILEVTYELAWAAARDAANRSARLAGRRVWSKEDYNEAVQVLNKLLPPEVKT